MLSAVSSDIARQLSKFSLAGFINTTIGYIVIFGGMALGLSPYTSNLIGYMVGLISSFFMSKFFVFTSESKSRYQVIRFLIAFCIAYIANIAFLHIALQLNINSVVAQIGAGGVYVLVMFTLSRQWVFN